MSAKKNTRGNRSSSLFTFNIGTLIFGAILMYIVISLIIYATTKHISTYQVIAGPLAQNQTYTALAVRQETVVKSNNDGYIRYYAREGRKVSKTGAVYSLAQSPEKSSGTTELSEESLSKIRALTAQFASSFTPDNFGQVYSFKYSLTGSILFHSIFF